jgi:hypothetical protein
MFGSSVLGYREEGLPSFRSRVARTKQTRMSDQILANTDEDIDSSCQVNALRDELIGKRLPTVDFAHVNLA